MIAEIFTAALPALVTHLTDTFSTRRRDSVDVRELQEQVARLAATQNSLQGNLAEVEHAVLILTRYLALTRQDAFSLAGEQLVLAEQFRSRREAVVTPVMTDFGARVEQSIEKHQNQAIEAFRRQQSSAPTAPAERDMPWPNSPQHRGGTRSPHDFLDTFAEEVLDLRLGRE
jgi:hypothetical protein